MFCVYCGQTYEAWLLEGGRCKRMIVCKPCYDKPYIEGQSIFKYCCDCSTELSKDETCPVCSKHKVSKRSLKWQAKNRHKVNIEQYSRVHADSLTILYECPCVHHRKHNHHFSYDPEFRLVVIRLCPACHSAEHRRLRLLAADAANDSSKSNPEELISINAGRGNMNPLNANLAPIMQRT